MEGGLELEDDVFFADLSKQISRLIMDDDDDDKSIVSHCPSVNLQAFTQAIRPATHTSILVNNDRQLQTCTGKRESSKGTGVFIPRSSSHSRRRNIAKQTRFTGSANQFQRHNHNSRSSGLSHMACNNNNNNNINPSNDDSFNLRRF